MTAPTVTEVPLHMEAVTPDPFIGGAYRFTRALAPKGNRRPR